MLPVSGAPQLNICGAHKERPIISHKYPYSKFDNPAPSKRSFGFSLALSPNNSFLALAALSNCKKNKMHSKQNNEFINMSNYAKFIYT